MASIINAATSGGLVTTADTSGILQLQTAGTTAVTVDASQRVGIGTTGPAKPLNVASSATTEVWIESTSTQKAILSLSAGDTSVGITSTYNSGGSAPRPFIFYNVSTPLLQFDLGKSIALQGASTATGTGITFPATQSASSNANTLDDYEEGTWTASFVPNTSGSITMTLNTGTYTKVGRIVTINGLFKVSSVSSPTGYLKINGLPFSGGSNASLRCSISIVGDSMNATMTTTLVASVQGGSEIYVFKTDGVGGLALTTAADMKANTEIFVGGTYTID